MVPPPSSLCGVLWDYGHKLDGSLHQPSRGRCTYQAHFTDVEAKAQSAEARASHFGALSNLWGPRSCISGQPQGRPGAGGWQGPGLGPRRRYCHLGQRVPPAYGEAEPQTPPSPAGLSPSQAEQAGPARAGEALGATEVERTPEAARCRCQTGPHSPPLLCREQNSGK